MSENEKLPSWFYEFADAVTNVTLAIVEPNLDRALDGGIRAKVRETLSRQIREAVTEAVLTCLHDSPMNGESQK